MAARLAASLRPAVCGFWVATRGFCRTPAGLAVFCQGALPGEVLMAVVERVRAGHATARKLRSLAPHAHAVPPPCPVFGACGGCALQSVAYEAQLRYKQEQVAAALSRIAKIPNAQHLLLPILGASAGAGAPTTCAGGASMPRPAAQGSSSKGGGSGGEGGGRSSSSSKGGGSGGEGGGHGSEHDRPGLYRYRNKMQFSFGGVRWVPPTPTGGDGTVVGASGGGGSSSGGGGGADGGGGATMRQFTLGLQRPGRHDQVLHVDACLLQDATSNALLAACAGALSHLPPYSPDTGQGLLRDLVIRSGAGARADAGAVPSGHGAERAREYLVNVITARPAGAELAALTRQLPAHFPQLVGIVNTVDALRPATRRAALRGRRPARSRAAPKPAASTGPDDGLDGSAGGGARLQEAVLWGRGHVVEALCGLELRVSANSFFQTNTRQAEVLYSAVRRAAGVCPGDVLLDLFCGTGSIGLALAAPAAALVGFDVNASAIRDARDNAARNGLQGKARFVVADLDEAGALLGRDLPAPDVIVTDPARAGMAPPLVSFLRGSGARRIVYVSCNPATMARDLARLAEPAAATAAGERPYGATAVQAVDMFPHTAHVEVVATLDACS